MVEQLERNQIEPALMERTVATAARWWAEQLTAAKASVAEQAGARPGDPIADPFSEGLYGMGVRNAMAHVTPEAVAIFRVSLERILRDRVTESYAGGDPWPDRYNGMGFGSDYGPGPEVGDALDCAGLTKGQMFLVPMKTTMWFGSKGVRVAAGYGARSEYVPLIRWPSEPAALSEEGR